MDLATRQAVMARLAVEAGLRSRFFAQPSSAAADLQLAPDEAERLATQLRDLPQFAQSLVRKRLSAVRQLLPKTARLAGELFTEELRRYAWDHPSEGPRRHERDALALAKRLRPALEGKKLRTLLLESGWVEASLGRRLVCRVAGPMSFALWVRTGRRVRFWRFRFDAAA